MKTWYWCSVERLLQSLDSENNRHVICNYLYLIKPTESKLDILYIISRLTNMFSMI